VDKQKNYSRKLIELQTTVTTLTGEKKCLEERIRHLEAEKVRLHDRWVRITAKNRLEEKSRSK
jgi:predicted nuclease with TOPRIM domain